MICLLNAISAEILGMPSGSGLLASARLRGDSGSLIFWVLAAAGIIAAIVGALAFASRTHHHRRTNSHPGLFAGLCQHHNLDRSSRNLLMALGQAHRVRYAARVFLDPTLFEPNHLPPALRSRKEEILALRQQLFLVGNESTSPPQCGE